MPYEFDEQLRIGKKYEAEQDRFYGKDWVIAEATKEQERQSIDRTFSHNKFPWVTFTVEYKADEKANEFGNLFIEVASSENVPGTHWRCAANYMSVIIPQRMEFRMLSVVRLKHYIPAWLMRYPLKEVPNSRNGHTWTTFGVPVPLEIIDTALVMGGPFWAPNE